MDTKNDGLEDASPFKNCYAAMLIYFGYLYLYNNIEIRRL